MEPVDFAQVLDAARAGEEWAISAIYRDLHPRLAGYFRAQEPRAADDLEAEVWLAFAERLHAFTGDADALRAWMFSIARRRLADHRRTAVRRRTDVVPIEQLDGPAPEDPAALVLDGLAADEAARFVVGVLPAAQAEVILLRVLADLSVDEVAEILGKRPGTVRVLSHRALRTLESRLTGKSVTR